MIYFPVNPVFPCFCLNRIPAFLSAHREDTDWQQLGEFNKHSVEKVLTAADTEDRQVDTTISETTHH